MKVVFAYLTLLVLLIACSGNTTPETNQTTDDAGADVAAGDAAAESADASSALRDLFAQDGEWKISYDLKTSGGEEAFSGKMTQYVKGESVRMDSIANGMESRTYVVDETVTVCSKTQAWECFSMGTPEEQEQQPTDALDEFEEQPDDYSVTADGTKTVIGITAQCFRMQQKGETGYTRYCLGKDGVPLYIYSQYDGMTSEMTATEYSKSVSASDFTPPAEAKDISAMYGGAGGTYPAGGSPQDACAYCDYLSGTDKDECLASC